MLIRVGWALWEKQLYSEISVASRDSSLFLHHATCHCELVGGPAPFFLRTWVDGDRTQLVVHPREWYCPTELPTMMNVLFVQCKAVSASRMWLLRT